jgi:uncharacterized membrane protein
MKELLSVGFIWLHLLATVVWLGGMAFILSVALPSSRKALGDDAGRVMGEVTRRFTPLANGSILLLFLSGLALLATTGGFSEVVLRGGRDTAMVFKLLLFLLMAAVHFYRSKVLAPRIARTPPEEGKATLQKLSLNLVKVNLVAGLAVLLLSAVAG